MVALSNNLGLKMAIPTLSASNNTFPFLNLPLPPLPTPETNLSTPSSPQGQPLKKVKRKRNNKPPTSAAAADGGSSSTTTSKKITAASAPILQNQNKHLRTSYQQNTSAAAAAAPNEVATTILSMMKSSNNSSTPLSTPKSPSPTEIDEKEAAGGGSAPKETESERRRTKYFEGQKRIAVWDTKNSRKISGFTAPMFKNLRKYLNDNPHMELYDPAKHNPNAYARLNRHKYQTVARNAAAELMPNSHASEVLSSNAEGGGGGGSPSPSTSNENENTSSQQPVKKKLKKTETNTSHNPNASSDNSESAARALSIASSNQIANSQAEGKDKAEYERCLLAARVHFPLLIEEIEKCQKSNMPYEQMYNLFLQRAQQSVAATTLQTAAAAQPQTAAAATYHQPAATLPQAGHPAINFSVSSLLPESQIHPALATIHLMYYQAQQQLLAKQQAELKLSYYQQQFQAWQQQALQQQAIQQQPAAQYYHPQMLQGMQNQLLQNPPQTASQHIPQQFYTAPAASAAPRVIKPIPLYAKSTAPPTSAPQSLNNFIPN